jgi:YegS/Rv2252/BmrU family lipid kinase
MKVALVVNPQAGQGRPIRALREVLKELEREEVAVEVFYSEGPGGVKEATLKAAEIRPDRVVVIGGDGSLNEAVNGLIDCPVPIGIIPAGTANVFAREMGIPLSTREAARVVLGEGERVIDLGQANQRYFLLMVGVGFDAQVVAKVSLEVKEIFKDLAYVFTGFNELRRYQPCPMTVRFGDQTKDSFFTVVANARYYAGKYSLAEKASIDDGLLDICLFKSETQLGLVKLVLSVVTGTHLGLKELEYYFAKTVEVDSEQPLWVQCDGEVLGKTPVTIKLHPKKLRVIVPAKGYLP